MITVSRKHLDSSHYPVFANAAGVKQSSTLPSLRRNQRKATQFSPVFANAAGGSNPAATCNWLDHRVAAAPREDEVSRLCEHWCEAIQAFAAIAVAGSPRRVAPRESGRSGIIVFIGLISY
jgi:hypothetical protein